MITIIDYDMGNLKSISNALNYLKIEHETTGNKSKVINAEKIILPGVGAFKDAMEIIRNKGFDKIIKDKAQRGTPILGVCLGMQLLFDKSYEGVRTDGLGLIHGEVVKLSNINRGTKVKIPHIGWNNMKIKHENKLILGLKENDFVYFVHSYYAKVADEINSISETIYGENKIAAIVGEKNILGTQFHPEKSGDIGLSILQNFNKYF